MLCPRVSNFPPPKVITSSKQSENLVPVKQTLKMNYFYNSIMITCPDELHVPISIKEKLIEDSDYYRISKISLTEFLEPTFIENFVKKGSLHGLSVDRNCITQNCVALTPDGHLILHINDFEFQTLGLVGIQRPYNFYEVKIDLKNLSKVEKIQNSLRKLGLFTFNMIWEPNQDNVCPSSIAKYFHKRNIKVSLCILDVSKFNPVIKEIPSLEDVDIEEMVEWTGMLSHKVNVSPTETYISTYSQPDSDSAIKSNRITILIVKGLVTPTRLSDVCTSLSEYTSSRELDNYWTSISIQSKDCLWQWNPSSPKMFQSHDSSCNIFFTKTGNKIYSVGQLKYS